MTTRHRLTQHRATFLDRSELRVVWIVTSAGHVLDELADDAGDELAAVLANRDLVAASPTYWHVTRGDNGAAVLVVDLIVV